MVLAARVFGRQRHSLLAVSVLASPQMHDFAVQSTFGIAISLSKTAMEARFGALEGDIRCLVHVRCSDLNHR